MIVIIGGGITGLSASYHAGHDRCVVLEKCGHPYGLVASRQRGGFIWDQGPHVSFTKHEYVRNLFAESVKGEYDEYSVKVGNYFKGHWIDHPAQTSLYQVPEPLRTRCLESFLASRNGAQAAPVENYQQWLDRAFGEAFTEAFPAAYTRKYWTLPPRDLTADWLGNRVFLPNVDEVMKGSRGPLNHSTHYITTVRYPKRGGYQSFVRRMAQGCNLRLNSEVAQIDLHSRQVLLTDGERIGFTTLINTIPLPEFIALCRDVPADVRGAGAALDCTGMVLVDVEAPELCGRPENWLYVYDEDMVSTRLHFVEKLTTNNAPPGWTGIQTEVPFSRQKPLVMSLERYGDVVFDELVQMGILSSGARDARRNGKARVHVRKVPYANVIFHHQTKLALDVIWQWLETFGLRRDDEDTSPLTDWGRQINITRRKAEGGLHMGGRFGQWKYYWSDDCTMSGKRIADSI